MLRTSVIAVVGVLVGLALHAQTFDAASVKITTYEPRGGDQRSRSRIEFTPTTLRMSNVTLRDCIQWAYNAPFYEVTGPNLLDGVRFDIMARTPDPVPPADLRRMLQALLAERFKLALHRETKTFPVYELVVEKGGPKLPPRNTDAESATVHSLDSLPLVRDGSFVFPNASMAEFAAKLSLLRGVDVPVIDKTGIKGSYDIVLKGAAEAVRQDDGASISEFVRQIGLKMVHAKDPMEVIVVDSASRPSQN